MAKRKTDEKAEQIEKLQSALAWALTFAKTKTPCGGLCLYCGAEKLLDGLKPRKWGTK